MVDRIKFLSIKQTEARSEIYFWKFQNTKTNIGKLVKFKIKWRKM